jgi:transposase
MFAPASDAPRSRAVIRQIWMDRLERFVTAGQAPAEFCAAEGVSVASFYGWKRRLAAESAAAAAVDPTRLLPVRLTAGPTPVELLLPSGVVLRLSPGCDFDFIRSLLATLGATPC